MQEKIAVATETQHYGEQAGRRLASRLGVDFTNAVPLCRTCAFYTTVPRPDCLNKNNTPDRPCSEGL